MMVVIPTYSGIGPVAQFVVPVAMPAPPVELDQVTCVSPALSCAVPFIEIEVADVETVVMAGERMVIDGGAVLPPVPGLAGGVGFAGALGRWLVTFTVCAALSCCAF